MERELMTVADVPEVSVEACGRPQAPDCPLYGLHPYLSVHILVPSNGNRCALLSLVRNAHSPCQMELAGNRPVWNSCHPELSNALHLLAEWLRDWQVVGPG